MLLGFKTRVELNNKQRTLAMQHAGVARHAYNWGVAHCAKAYEETKKIPSAIDLHKLLVRDVKSVNPWYYEVSKCAPQQALRNLSNSYNNFHTKQKKNGYKLLRKTKHGNVLEGLPKFKKKGQCEDKFYLEGKILIDGNKIKVPYFGWLKCNEVLPICDVKNVTISRVADDWFISYKRPLKIEDTVKNKCIVGVDLGIKTLATLSDGVVYPSIKPYKKQKRKLRILQRKQSKKHKKGVKEQSNNYKKASLKVAKLHQKISCIRNDYTHKLTTYLAKNHGEIVIEDLHVRGMSKNHQLASAILDGGFFEFRRQLEYKTKMHGADLTVVNRSYPSSKTCSCCGKKKKDLKLSDRIFKCECGYEADRDLNAAINLVKMAVSYTDIQNACGGTKNVANCSNDTYETGIKQQL